MALPMLMASQNSITRSRSGDNTCFRNGCTEDAPITCNVYSAIINNNNNNDNDNRIFNNG